MGWRYRRSFKLMPGIRVNVGSKGVTSMSFGGRGMTVNVGKRGTRTTYSIPGTGLSYQTKTVRASQKVSPPLRTQSTGSPRVASPAALRAVVVVGALAFIAFLAHGSGGSPTSRPPVRVGVASVPDASPPTELPRLIAPAMAGTSGSPAAENAAAAALNVQRATTTTGANVRSLPSASGKIVTVLSSGTAVRLGASEGPWRRVLDDEGTPVGWVHSSIVR